MSVNGWTLGCSSFLGFIKVLADYVILFKNFRMYHLERQIVYFGTSLTGKLALHVGTEPRQWFFVYRQWSSNGLSTTVNTSNNVVRCVSTHLTSFAVLVDVNGLEGDVSDCTHYKSLKPFVTLFIL